ncbi:MAG: lysoplasmalogenase [Saprospiraceae bacterium]
MKTPPLLAVFIALSVVHLAAVLFQWQPGMYLTKPLLLTTLAIWFFMQTKNHPSKFSRFVLAGLVCSIAGDTFLMFGKEIYFLLGLGSFLLAHICYITAFTLFPGFKSGAVRRQPLLTLPFLLFLFLINRSLWNDLPVAFVVPVLAYSATITLMALSSLNMARRVKKFTGMVLLWGALLFVLSDTMIAFERFKAIGLPPVFMRFSIMATYLAGQFLLAKGGILANSEN